MSENRYTIFYTDDDPEDQDFFKEVVSEINPVYSIFMQNDGIELLDILKNPPPSPTVVFLDLNMPKKTGYQVLKEIREMDVSKDIPVVIFSTSNDEAAIQKAKDLGANLFITKPGSYHDFKKLLHSVLSLKWPNDFSEDKFFFTIN